jgi:guanylate kinase
VRETLPGATQVFIAPPSVEDLEARLRGRASDSPDQIARRLDAAPTELAAKEEFSKIVVNDDLDTALGELVELAARICGPDSRDLS